MASDGSSGVSVGDGASTVSAGWYPDPADPARLRRWDGDGWTKDVILAPDEDPIGFVPSSTPPQPTENLAAATPLSAPPAGLVPPPSPAPTSTPPQASAPAVTPTATAPPTSAAAAPTPSPAAAPTFADDPTQAAAAPAAEATQSAPVAPAAAPAAAQQAPPPQRMAQVAEERRPDPPSGPVSLPDWANLPGLTLPPDLSSLPGMEQSSVLPPPTFEDPALQLSAPSWQQGSILPPPTFEPEPDPEPAPAPPAARPAPDLPPPAPPQRGRTPGSESYAPPPAGGQYNVPPPPGVPHIPAPGLLPPSSLVSPGMPSAAWASLPQIDQGTVPPIDYEAMPRTSVDPNDADAATGLVTPWAWLIAVLPLLQFLGIYLAFKQLNVVFAPGSEWGILAAPAVLALLFAVFDRRILVAAGARRAPSPLLAIIPPIYLLARTIEIGRSSAMTLVGWLILQGAAAAGVYYLLPHLLTQVLRSIG